MTLRARLTLFYSGILGAILLVLCAALLWSEPRVELELLDTDLRRDAVTVESVLLNETAEGHDRQSGILDMLGELKLPGRGLAIYDAGGALLGARWEDLDPTEPAYRPADTLEVPRTIMTVGGPARVYQHAVGRPGDSILVIVTSLAPIGRDMAVLRRSLSLAIPIAVLGAAVGGWWFLTRALRPLESMAREAGHITALDPRRRLSVPATPDEVKALAAAFNALLERLGTALERQREFMADASHELRTPASVARTAAEVTLSSEARSQEEYRDALRIVSAQTRRMSRLTDEMLMLARADMGRRPLDQADFYLDEVVREAASSLQMLAAARRITVTAECSPDLQMRGDEALVRQLALNLIDNAIRHSPDGATVHVHVVRDASRALLEVSDDGPGVPEAERQRIFERFVKLDPSRNHQGGAGLGLPIARWIAEAHGGSLGLALSSSNGSTFRAALSLRTEIPPQT